MMISRSILTKRCSKCGGEFPLDLFFQDKRSKDGRRNPCKGCTAKEVKRRASSKSPPNEKRCSICGNIKPIKDYHKRCNNIDGYDNRCKICANILIKNSSLLRNYNISLEEYEDMKIRQGNRCLFCNRNPKSRSLNVDHCHHTGIVRGLLCYPCNRFLGYIHDDIGVLETMISYLKANS